MILTKSIQMLRSVRTQPIEQIIAKLIAKHSDHNIDLEEPEAAVSAIARCPGLTCSDL